MVVFRLLAHFSKGVRVSGVGGGDGVSDGLARRVQVAGMSMVSVGYGVAMRFISAAKSRYITSRARAAIATITNTMIDHLYFDMGFYVEQGVEDDGEAGGEQVGDDQGAGLEGEVGEQGEGDDGLEDGQEQDAGWAVEVEPGEQEEAQAGDAVEVRPGVGEEVRVWRDRVQWYPPGSGMQRPGRGCFSELLARAVTSWIGCR